MPPDVKIRCPETVKPICINWPVSQGHLGWGGWGWRYNMCEHCGGIYTGNIVKMGCLTQLENILKAAQYNYFSCYTFVFLFIKQIYQ